MIKSHAFVLCISCCVGIVCGCRQVEQHAKQTSGQMRTAAKNVKSQLKKIQAHGEVDIEVMSQLTAVNDAYRKFLETKSTPPKAWSDLEAIGDMTSVIQDAHRANAYVRFGLKQKQLADEARATETLIAIRSINDGMIWAMTFNGDVASLTEEEFRAVSNLK